MENSKKKAAVEKQIRKPIKFAFQTRSIVDILDDGYRWRKYGQKAVKTKKFPRSYYRCTYDGCNVKKQVQRSCRDEGVVVTTYEGRHTHPLEKPLRQFRTHSQSDADLSNALRNIYSDCIQILNIRVRN